MILQNSASCDHKQLGFMLSTLLFHVWAPKKKTTDLPFCFQHQHKHFTKGKFKHFWYLAWVMEPIYPLGWSAVAKDDDSEEKKEDKCCQSQYDCQREGDKLHLGLDGNSSWNENCANKCFLYTGSTIFCKGSTNMLLLLCSNSWSSYWPMEMHIVQTSALFINIGHIVTKPARSKTKRAIFFCWLPFLPYCRPFVEAKGGLGIVEFSLFDLLCPWSIGLRHWYWNQYFL